MAFTLRKRLDNYIITETEYNIAMTDYHQINDNIHKIGSDSKKKRYLDKNRLCIPKEKKKRSTIKKTPYIQKIEKAIIELSKNKGLFTYATISEKIGNTRQGAICVGRAICILWEYYYDRSDVYDGF